MHITKRQAVGDIIDDHIKTAMFLKKTAFKKINLILWSYGH